MSEENEKPTEQVSEQEIQEPIDNSETTPQDESETTPTQPTEPPQNQEEVEKELEKQGFDYAALEQEYFANNGELTKETKAQLNKLGITDEFIADFINGKKVIVK